MNIEHIQEKLDCIDCNLQIGGISNPNQNERALLIGEIEDAIIAYGQVYGLTEEHNEFHGVMDALRKLRGSITPKQCFYHKELVSAWLRELEESDIITGTSTMPLLDVLKQLILEFETLLPMHPFDLQKAREMASRWIGPQSPIVPEEDHKGIPALDAKLVELVSAVFDDHAKLLIRDILRLADKERLKRENENT